MGYFGVNRKEVDAPNCQLLPGRVCLHRELLHAKMVSGRLIWKITPSCVRDI